MFDYNVQLLEASGPRLKRWTPICSPIHVIRESDFSVNVRLPSRSRSFETLSPLHMTLQRTWTIQVLIVFLLKSSWLWIFNGLPLFSRETKFTSEWNSNVDHELFEDEYQSVAVSFLISWESKRKMRKVFRNVTLDLFALVKNWILFSYFNNVASVLR